MQICGLLLFSVRFVGSFYICIIKAIVLKLICTIYPVKMELAYLAI